MPSNFKKLVRARMAETGETWQPAARYIRGLKEPPQAPAVEQKYREWLVGSDTGLSSQTIWAVMVGRPPVANGPFGPAVPLDPSDFGRCYRLLELFPEWKHRLHEVAEKHPKWGPVIREWARLTEMYETALESGEARAPGMYDLMQKLVKEGRGEPG